MNNNPERIGSILNVVLGICLVLWIIVTAVLILPAWRNYRNVRAEEERQRTLLEEAKMERQQQMERKKRLENSPAEIEKVAREKFHLVKKGEIVMRYPSEKKMPEKTGKGKKKSKFSGKKL